MLPSLASPAPIRRRIIRPKPDAAKRPNSISRVFSGCSVRENSCNLQQLPHRIPKAPGVCLALETNDEVVRIADHYNSPLASRRLRRSARRLKPDVRASSTELLGLEGVFAIRQNHSSTHFPEKVVIDEHSNHFACCDQKMVAVAHIHFLPGQEVSLPCTFCGGVRVACFDHFLGKSGQQALSFWFENRLPESSLQLMPAYLIRFLAGRAQRRGVWVGGNEKAVSLQQAPCSTQASASSSLVRYISVNEQTIRSYEFSGRPNLPKTFK